MSTKLSIKDLKELFEIYLNSYEGVYVCSNDSKVWFEYEEGEILDSKDVLSMMIYDIDENAFPDLGREDLESCIDYLKLILENTGDNK